MKKIKENIEEIGFLIIVMMLLLYVALTPNQDVEQRKEYLRTQQLKDSLEMEYYKKQLESQDTTKNKLKIKSL